MSRESWNRREWRYDSETLANGWVEVLEEGQPIVEYGNAQVEFPWGNLPLQPNLDRDLEPEVNDNNTGGGPNDLYWSQTTKVMSDTLDPALDNHSIATGLPPFRFPGWNGYPGYLPGDNDNLPGNFVVPNVIGLTSGEAETVLDFASFTVNIVSLGNTSGATAENDGTVKGHSPSAGNTIEEGGLVTIFVYDYVYPYIFQLPVSRFSDLSVRWEIIDEAVRWFIISNFPDIPQELLDATDGGTNSSSLIGKTILFTGTGTVLDNEPILITTVSDMFADSSYLNGLSTVSSTLQSNLISGGQVTPNTGSISLLP